MLEGYVGSTPPKRCLERRSASGRMWNGSLGNLDSVDWQREFDLVVMCGHAFQVLVDDE